MARGRDTLSQRYDRFVGSNSRRCILRLGDEAGWNQKYWVSDLDDRKLCQRTISFGDWKRYLLLTVDNTGTAGALTNYSGSGVFTITNGVSSSSSSSLSVASSTATETTSTTSLASTTTPQTLSTGTGSTRLHIGES